MKTAVIGSRDLPIKDIGRYIPEGTDEIVSGGARGVDAAAREYALSRRLKLTEFLPDYKRFGRSAPLRRNDLIIDYADIVIALWDGTSRGTKYVIDKCEEKGVEVRVFIIG